MVAGKSFNFKFSAKIDILIGYFMLPLLMLTFSLKSLNTIFDKHLDHMLVKFKQNRMVRTLPNLELFDKKWLNCLWQSVERRFCNWKNSLMLNY